MYDIIPVFHSPPGYIHYIDTPVHGVSYYLGSMSVLKKDKQVCVTVQFLSLKSLESVKRNFKGTVVNRALSYLMEVFLNKKRDLEHSFRI